MYYDCHTHHASLHGEIVFQQDVDNYGIHPWSVTHENVDNLIIEFDNNVINNVFICLGECGLDKCCDAPYELQKQVFRHQILKSEELHKPIILHCVKAIDDVLQLRKELRAVQPWIFHGFRGKPEQLKQLLLHGFYFSFGFHHNEEAVKACPFDRLLLETDESEDDIRKLYERVARARNIPLSTLLYIIGENVRNIFPSKCCSFQL